MQLVGFQVVPPTGNKRVGMAASRSKRLVGNLSTLDSTAVPPAEISAMSSYDPGSRPRTRLRNISLDKVALKGEKSQKASDQSDAAKKWAELLANIKVGLKYTIITASDFGQG